MTRSRWKLKQCFCHIHGETFRLVHLISKTDLNQTTEKSWLEISLRATLQWWYRDWRQRWWWVFIFYWSFNPQNRKRRAKIIPVEHNSEFFTVILYDPTWQSVKRHFRLTSEFSKTILSRDLCHDHSCEWRDLRVCEGVWTQMNFWIKELINLILVKPIWFLYFVHVIIIVRSAKCGLQKGRLLGSKTTQLLYKKWRRNC